MITIDDYDEADWSEVFRTCCVRRPQQWLDALLGTCIVLFFGYFFLFSLVWFGDGAKSLSGCRVGELFGDYAHLVNPVTAAMIGVLATALIQSSSTTTAIAVILVASGSLSVSHASSNLLLDEKEQEEETIWETMASTFYNQTDPLQVKEFVQTVTILRVGIPSLFVAASLGIAYVAFGIIIYVAGCWSNSTVVGCCCYNICCKCHG